ncbi:long-chain acyl-CoA synthetase [Actinocatenispora thailandica]|uniref:Acyl-CoA synthetase n=1 Tax=Actinocatenispora thailandica TaxID=227318 RepID=A0A7R7DRK2_9ACTN|nr:AMP-dependent synthetase/ligase [Actinocatenispora thailandica]BCJ36580.1 long-chain acyl-CoA synthetase [Actinocatenispora thailandica]
MVAEYGIPALVDPPSAGGLADSVYATAARAPQLVLFRRRTGSGWADVTAARFGTEVRAVAAGLVAIGVRPGDRVALMSRNRYEWAVLDYAIASVAAVSVPIYPTSSAAQVAWILRDSGAVCCVTETAGHTATVTAAGRTTSADAGESTAVTGGRSDAAVGGGLPALAHRFELDSGGLDELRRRGTAVDGSTVDARRASVGPGDAATIIYTSGTTGRPKGCVLTHANLMAEADNATELLYPVFRAVSRRPASTVLFLPLAHVFGRVIQVGCVRAEVCVGHSPSVKPAELLPDLASFRPTFLLAVPYVFEKVFHTARATAEDLGRAASFDRAARIATAYGAALERRVNGTGRGPGLRLRAAHALYDLLVYRRVRAALGGRVRYAISGGAMLGRRLALFFAGAGIVVYEGYGLTETTAAATVNPPLAPRFGSVGRPLPGTTVRVDEHGEVLVRGPQVFARYWGGDEPVTADGFLATGDLGELDDDGYLTITGRAKEILVTTGGKNVAPGPLEDAVRADPLVSQCLVVGDNRPYVAALVTLDPEAAQRFAERGGDVEAAVQRAIDRANDTVSRAESIRRFRLLDEDFTEQNGLLTPSLKMRRDRIVAAYARQLDDLYAARTAPVPAQPGAVGSDASRDDRMHT